MFCTNVCFSSCVNTTRRREEEKQKVSLENKKILNILGEQKINEKNIVKELIDAAVARDIQRCVIFYEIICQSNFE